MPPGSTIQTGDTRALLHQSGGSDHDSTHLRTAELNRRMAEEEEKRRIETVRERLLEKTGTTALGTTLTIDNILDALDSNDGDVESAVECLLGDMLVDEETDDETYDTLPVLTTEIGAVVQHGRPVMSPSEKFKPFGEGRINPEEARTVYDEILQAKGGQVDRSCRAEDSNAVPTLRFATIGSGIHILGGSCGTRITRAKDHVDANDRCWGLTAVANTDLKPQYIEFVVEGMAANMEGGDTSRVGVTTGTGELTPDCAFSPKSCHGETFMFDGHRVTLNDDNIHSEQHNSFKLDALQQGDRVGVLIHDNASFISLFLNGEESSKTQITNPDQYSGKQFRFVFDLRGKLRTIRLTSATQPMTYDELESVMLVGVAKCATRTTTDMLKCLKDAIKHAKTKGKQELLSKDDSQGRCPLHYLCANPKSTPEMLQLLVEEAPEALLVADSSGMTPLSCLLERECLFRVHDEVIIRNLVKDKKYNNKCGMVAKVLDDHVDIALQIFFPMTSSKCKLADNYQDCEDAGQGPMKPGKVYTIDRGRLDGSHVTVKNWSYNVKALIPIEETSAPNSITYCEDVFRFRICNVAHKNSIGVTAEHVRSLFAAGKSYVDDAIRLRGRAGELPIVTAERRKLNPDIIACLHNAFAGGVWCGGAALHGIVSEPGFHLLVHAHMSKKTRNQSQWDAMDSLTEFGKRNESFLRSSKINGLPFNVNDVKHVCVNSSSCAFLLCSGTIYRLDLSVLKASAGWEDGISSASTLALEQLDQKLRDTRNQLKQVERKLEQAKENEQSYSEDSVSTLADASGKARDDIINILKRLRLPEDQKLETAMNILLGIPPEDADYFEGDDVTRYENEIAALQSAVDDAQQSYDALKQREDEVCISAETLMHAGNLEKWDEAACKFTHATMSQSELFALGDNGKLYQWSTKSEHPYSRTMWAGESISDIAASNFRISVLTGSGKVATFVDPLLIANEITSNHDKVERENFLVESLEHPAILVGGETVETLAVTDHGTIAATKTGHVYFWGFTPPGYKNAAQNKCNDDEFEELMNEFIDTSTEYCVEVRNEEVIREKINALLEDTDLSEREKTKAFFENEVPKQIERMFKNLQHQYNSLSVNSEMPLRVGETVFFCGEEVPPEYPKGSRVLVELNGSYQMGALRSNLNASDVNGEAMVEISYDDNTIVSHPLKDLIFMERKVCSQNKVKLLTVDHQRNLAVVKADGDNNVQIVDIQSISSILPSQPVIHDRVLKKPICILDPREIFDYKQLDIVNLDAVDWNISARVISPQQEDIIYQWGANLLTAEWTASPKFCNAVTEIPRMFITESISLEFDSNGTVFNPSISGLPRVSCIGASSILLPYTLHCKQKLEKRSSNGTLLLIGFDSSLPNVNAAPVSMKLHQGVAADSNLTEILENTSIELLKNMISNRNYYGETPFFAALKSKNVKFANAIFDKALTLNILEKACLPNDIYGRSPLHALFGLADDKPQKVDISDLCDDEVLTKLFENIENTKECNSLLRARDRHQLTVLQSLFKLRKKDAFHGRHILKVFLQTESALKSVIDACEGGLLNLDSFVLDIFEFSRSQPLFTDLGKWIGLWIKNSLDIDHLKDSAMKLNISLCRMFCALCSTENHKDDPSCNTSNLFYSIFAVVPSSSVEILAEIACKVVKVVCLGLPLSSLPKGGKEILRKHNSVAVEHQKSETKGKISGLHHANSQVVFVDTDGDEIRYTLNKDRKVEKYVSGKFMRVVDYFRYDTRSGHLQDRERNSPMCNVSTIPKAIREKTIAAFRELAAEADVTDESDKRFSRGSKVKLVEHYEEVTDAKHGPMKPGKTYTIDSTSGTNVNVKGWYYSVDALVAVEEEEEENTQINLKLQRAHIYRQCVKTIALLCIDTAVESSTLTESLQGIEQTLHSSWVYISDCCNACELGLTSVNSLNAKLGEAELFINAAFGVSTPAADQYEYVAVMLDAVISLKKAVSDCIDENSRSIHAPRLMRNVSYMYTDIQDPESKLKVHEFMKSYGNNPMNVEVDHDFHMLKCKHLFESPVHEALHQWRRSIKFFGQNYNIPGTLFSLLAPYGKKEAQFRGCMADKVRECKKNGKCMKLHVGTSKPVCDTIFEIIQSKRKSLENSKSEPLCMDLDMKSSFGGGEGKGPIREIFNACATDLKAGRGMASGCFVPSPNKARVEGEWWKTKPFSRVVVNTDDGCRGEDSLEEYLDRFRCIGNIIGLSLLHGGSTYEIRFPLFFCRHVYKYLLGRKITFDDYAFFDPEDHETLHTFLHRRGDQWKNYAGLQWDKSVGYSGVPVDVTDEVDGERGLRAYVEAKWMWRMIGSVKSELDALRSGIHEVIPADVFEDLTADDLQMLMSGTGNSLVLDDFKVEGVLNFVDERSESLKRTDPSRLEQFKGVFWDTLKAMSELELMEFANYTIASYSSISKLTVKLRDSAGTTESPVFSRTCTKELVLSLGNDDIDDKMLLGYLQFAMKMNAVMPFDII